jgi:hypothetical protein
MKHTKPLTIRRLGVVGTVLALVGLGMFLWTGTFVSIGKSPLLYIALSFVGMFLFGVGGSFIMNALRTWFRERRFED